MLIRTSDVAQALTGLVLQERMLTTKDQRKPYVESLIYAHTITMMAAEPGLGKSTLLTQMAIEMSSGKPVFGYFETKRQLKILFCQNERPILEFLERLEVINRVLPINYNNLYITDEYKLFNLLKEDHVGTMIECMKRDCPNVDVIILDPIYPLVPGGLSKDEPSALFCKAMSLVQKETGASLIYAHHTTKPMHSSSGEVIEKDDPYFGTVWLKAHVTGSYHIKKHDGGVELVKKKDNYRSMTDKITLEYDSETGLSTVRNSELPALERAKLYLTTRKKSGNQPFTFEDFRRGCDVSVRCAREMLVHNCIKDTIKSVSTNHNKHLYTIL